jgi:hypothetical protein
MDALTFGTTVLLRHLTFSEARKMPIKEFYLDKVLQALDFTMNEVRLSYSPEHHIVDSAGSNLYSSFLVFI